MVLNIAMNYGGRAELTHAFQDLARRVQEGSLRPEDITEERISSRALHGRPAGPDLIIRPSGEHRTSNFSAVAVGLCGICDYGYPVAGFPPGRFGRRPAGVCKPQPALWRDLAC